VLVVFVVTLTGMTACTTAGMSMSAVPLSVLSVVTFAVARRIAAAPYLERAFGGLP
jgi:hypothetical protein